MKEKFYIGIDVGGTKIAAGLTDQSGKLLQRLKRSTPKQANSKAIFNVLVELSEDLLAKQSLSFSRLGGIGIGIPGIVNAIDGEIITTPNMQLSGYKLVKNLKQRLVKNIFIENDVNLGLLGEYSFGVAKKTSTVAGLFPGTGVGGAIIVDGKLFNPRIGSGEIGHMILQAYGPRCSCGNKGCLESLAGRWAIERDIRKAIKSGECCIITQYTSNLRRIKSKLIKRALAKKDPVVTRVMRKASEALGLGCVSLRHIFNPEMIVLGGGLIEACGDFMLPIIEKKVQSDPFFAKVPGCEIVRSRLLDDAVILGAAALAIENSGSKIISGRSLPDVSIIRPGIIRIDNKIYRRDIYIRADGKAKKRSKKNAADCDRVDSQEVKKICKKSPQILLIGSNRPRGLALTTAAKRFLMSQHIVFKLLSLSQAIAAYHNTTRRKAMLLQITA